MNCLVVVTDDADSWSNSTVVMDIVVDVVIVLMTMQIGHNVLEISSYLLLFYCQYSCSYLVECICERKWCRSMADSVDDYYGRLS